MAAVRQSFLLIQQSPRLNPQFLTDFEEGLQRNPACGARSLHLSQEIQAASNLLGKRLLRVACLLAVIGNAQVVRPLCGKLSHFRVLIGSGHCHFRFRRTIEWL